MPCYAPKFAKAESQCCPGRHCGSELVHACCEADRIGKSQSEQIHRQTRRAENRLDRITNDFVPAYPCQSAHRSFMRLFCVLGKENRPNHPAIKPTHAGLLAERLWKRKIASDQLETREPRLEPSPILQRKARGDALKSGNPPCSFGKRDYATCPRREPF